MSVGIRRPGQACDGRSRGILDAHGHWMPATREPAVRGCLVCPGGVRMDGLPSSRALPFCCSAGGSVAVIGAVSSFLEIQRVRYTVARRCR